MNKQTIKGLGIFLILIFFVVTISYADVVVFSHKGNILSRVHIEDGAVINPEQCARNNRLKAEQITVQYYKKDDIKETEEEIDTIKDLKKQLKFFKKLQSQKERKGRNLETDMLNDSAT